MADSGTDLGRAARRLIRQSTVATLATTGRPDSPVAGFPYGSLVLVAADHDAAPLLLISRLAEHTKNLAGDKRISLLFDGTAGLADPLTGSRLTLLGEVEPATQPHQRARFLARHPSAETYAGFADFSLFRVRPMRAHLVAGFGKIHWIEAQALGFDASGAAALVEAEPRIVSHMNEDHADAIGLYATALLGAEAGAWRMVGVDPEGVDLRLDPARSARLDFESPIRDASEARARLVALVKQARGSAPATATAQGP